MPCLAGSSDPAGSLAEESRGGEQVGQSSWVARIVFWVLGGTLFLSIALLPNLLLAWFYTGGSAHIVAVPTIAVAVGLLWGASALDKS